MLIVVTTALPETNKGNPEVLEVASQYGDPYQVLAPVSHAAHGSGTLW